MTIAFIGTHNTGKTTVFEALKNKKPDFTYFSESIRHQMPSFGYGDNYFQLIQEIGIGTFQMMNMNSLTVIDPKANTLLDSSKTVIVDRLSIDHYAYYLTVRNKDVDFQLEPVLKNMAKHYINLVDKIVYFPITDLPFEVDQARVSEWKDYQKSVDDNIHVALKELDVDASKVYTLKSLSVEDRTQEILNIIDPV